MSTPIIIPGEIPPYAMDIAPIPQVTPFTFRDGASFLDRLERLIKYINRYVLPLINTQMNDLATEVTTEINSLIDEVNATIQQVIDSSIELQDPVMAAIVENTVSESRVALDALYASVGSVTSISGRVTSLETLTDEGRLSDGSLSVKIDSQMPDQVANSTAVLQNIINTAINNGEKVVKLERNQVYVISAPLQLSSTTDLTAFRNSIKLIGPAIIKPSNTFIGDHVIKHSQSNAQAAAGSMALGFGLKDIEIDGSNLIASNVGGVKIDGAITPVLDNVYIHNMTGNGVNFLTDNTIDSSTDDTYAVVSMIMTGVRVSNCSGWGIYQTRFAAPFTARGCYINNNVAGGIHITAPNIVWDGGAVAYNGGIGIHVALCTSPTASSLSNVVFTSVEIDSNTTNNIWIENAFNVKFVTCRIITKQVGSVYTTPQMVRLGGTAGLVVNAIKFDKPYIRGNQTTNPPLTVFQFEAQATDCRVEDYFELTGISTARIYGSRLGVRNTITRVDGLKLISVTDTNANAYAQAYISGVVAVSTAQTDLIFDTETVDLASRYDPVLSEYSIGDDNGLFAIEGFVTVDGASATTNRWVRIAFRYFDGTSYSTIKYATVDVPGNSFDQQVPFSFKVRTTTSGAKLHLQIVASTGTNLKAGLNYSDLRMYKVN